MEVSSANGEIPRFWMLLRMGTTWNSSVRTEHVQWVWNAGLRLARNGKFGGRGNGVEWVEFWTASAHFSLFYYRGRLLGYEYLWAWELDLSTEMTKGPTLAQELCMYIGGGDVILHNVGYSHILVWQIWECHPVKLTLSQCPLK